AKIGSMASNKPARNVTRAMNLPDGSDGMIPFAEQDRWITQIGQRHVRFRSCQFLQWMHAGRHGGDAGPDGAGTTHIKRRIADDPNLFGANIRANLAAHRFQCLAGHVVTIDMVIAKAAAAEMTVQAVMAALLLRARADVA